MKNKELAITIPTYNRAKILKENIELMLEEIMYYSIPVYISDDSTDNQTQYIIEAFQKKYDYIYYFKNTPSLGHDKNCIYTIDLPKEAYVWYLGDSMIIKRGGIKKILEIIKTNNYDFISCNATGRNLDIPTNFLSDANQILTTLGWHLTMSGATIYNKKSILDLSDDLEKYKNFPQLALIFVKFGLTQSSLYWINDNLIYANKNKNSYWSKKIFDVFFGDFKNFVFNLNTTYSTESKNLILKKHSIYTGIFNYKSLLKYRIEGAFDYQIYLDNKENLNKYTDVNCFVVFLISKFPVFILKALKKFFK